MVLEQQQRMGRLTRRSDAFVEENLNGSTLGAVGTSPCSCTFISTQQCY